MALNAAMVFEVRSTATAGNANGGGFKTGSSGVDYSQQDAAQYSLTLVTTAAADAILLTSSASADMVGNIAFISAGTNFTVGRYEIISVSVGVSITLDRTCTTAAGAAGVVAIGGALSLGSSDDAIFETLVAGNKMWIKGGSGPITYNLGGTVTIGASGSSANVINIEGYALTRGDKPLNDTRPVLNAGAVTFTNGILIYWSNIAFTGTAASVFTTNSYNNIISCKFTNTSITADRVALTGKNNTFVFACEMISYRGSAFLSSGGTRYTVDSCYLHDSKAGATHNSSALSCNYINNIFRNFTTNAIVCQGASTEEINIIRNTIHGCNNTGTAISFASGVQQPHVYNNTISNFSVGISHSGVQVSQFDNYNNMFNNTTDVSAWVKGANDISITPGFSISDVTGTNGTTSGNILTSAGKDFTVLGVVAGRDFIYIVSGTGVTAGIYGITAVGTTTLTLDIAPGTSAVADKVYQISVGADFSVSTNLKATAYPGAFPGGYTTGYQDIGAVQRLEQGTGSGIPTVRL